MEPRIERFNNRNVQPLVSVIVLNYNGAGWLPKCFASLKEQTIIYQIEAILVDNNSSDNSITVGRQILGDFPTASLVINSDNLGFCEGNNCGARVAKGRWLFFLNSDTWLEPDCMEKLMAATEKMGVGAATPFVLNYPDNSYQDFGFYGFDVFGLPSPSNVANRTREIFIAGGCSYLIRADVFQKVGEFDAAFFMYADDADLSWRVWIAGYSIAGIYEARVHHRGAVAVNPGGGIQTTEFRTSDRKRFLSNRNCLKTLLQNSQHILLITIFPLLILFFLESLAGSLILRRWSFVRASFWDVLADCWKQRSRIGERRRLVAKSRVRSDFWMLRFFRWRINRWFEIKRLFQFGLPRVDAK